MIKFMLSFYQDENDDYGRFPKLIFLVEFAGNSRKKINKQAKDLKKDIKSFSKINTFD